MSVRASMIDLADLSEFLQQVEEPRFRQIGVGLSAWFANGAREPIGAVLGVSERGPLSPRRVIELEMRNDALRRAWAERWGHLSASDAARAMWTNFDTYVRRCWSRERRGPAPQDEPRATWWLLLTNDWPMPGVARLRAILRENGSGLLNIQSLIDGDPEQEEDEANGED
jgi:hypothetical protein